MLYKEIIEKFKNTKEKLNNIISKLPDNEIIAKDVLKETGSSAKIELKDDIKNSYYVYINDTIYLSNNDKKKDSYERLSVITHEIRHSLQSKVLQNINFISSNIEILVFLICVILFFLKLSINTYKIAFGIYLIVILVAIVLRSVLEIDAISSSVNMSYDYLRKKINSEDEARYVKRIYGILTKLMTPFMFISIFWGKLIRCIFVFMLYFIF